MSEKQTLVQRAQRALRGEEPWEPIMERITSFVRGDLDAQIAALRAELERKDAALKEAWLVLNVCEGELSAISHRGTVDANNVKNFSAEARAAILRIENALQPKEPPCQTA